MREATARCLLGRGIRGGAKARAFLEPRLADLRPPIGLAGLSEAVERLIQAVRTREQVGIFGDYDVDGVTTCALMTSFLRKLDVPCVPRVARREAGYGFGVEDAEFFAAQGCTLIITGDCGTSDLAAIEHARAANVDVVVVDHHTVPAEDSGAPHPALALVNPFRVDSEFGFTGLASVGLAFYLMAALRTKLRGLGMFASRAEPDVRELLDLVALGTVADLVPLRDENRILTAVGLRRLRELARPGLAALARVVGVDSASSIDEAVIGWKFGPRLNAPGRLGDARPSLELLLAEDRETADRWAKKIEALNDERRAEQARVLAEVDAQLGDADPGPVVVVAGHGWASGVVGIVAAKLVDRYHRPAFVIAVDEDTGIGRGSGRSGGHLHLYRALDACAELLDRFGGHAAAAGLTVAEKNIDALRAGLHAAAASGVAAMNDVASTEADAELSLADIDQAFVAELARLSPFGMANKRPAFVCRDTAVRTTRRVGDGSHLKLELVDRHGRQVPAIAFGMGEADPGAGATIDVVFAAVINTWRGRSEVQLEIVALQAAPRVTPGDDAG